MADFKISIVLPVYNGEKYLSQSIESCLNQSYRNIELIIVNDCSTDATLNIANQYAQKDDRIKIINNSENKKLPASLNIGHSACIGDFITWTSDDNFYEFDALKILLDSLLDKGVDVVYSNFTLIDDNDQMIRNVMLPGTENLIFGNVISCCFMYRKEVYQRNNGYNEAYFLIEDYDFWLRATLHSKFYQINQFLYKYRKHKESLTSQINVDDTKNSLWKKNINEMFAVFWKIFIKFNCSEITELSTKLLLSERIDFDWIIANNVKIKQIKIEIRKNQNFSNKVMLEKVFLQKTIAVMINEKDTKRNFSRSVFIMKNYIKALDKNSVKTLIKYSFFK